MYPAEFSLTWPTEKELNITKRTFAREIGKYSREQIDEALSYMINMAKDGERDYLKPNVLVFLRTIGQLNVNKAMYKIALPSPPETKEQRQERYAKALEHCQRLKGIFDD
jgi:hypothetical protein